MASVPAVRWVVLNADWLSAVFGLASALVFAWPVIMELSSRRQYDALMRMRRESRAPTSSNSSEAQALDRLREQLVDERLGGYQPLLRKVFGALLLLAISFVLALVYALNKTT